MTDWRIQIHFSFIEKHAIPLKIDVSEYPEKLINPLYSVSLYFYNTSFS